MNGSKRQFAWPRFWPRLLMFTHQAEGYECRVLEGAQQTFGRSASLAAITTEVATDLLAAQCCGQTWLLHLLRTSTPRWPWEVSCTRTNVDWSSGRNRDFEKTCTGYRPFDETLPTRLSRFQRRAVLGLLNFSVGAYPQEAESRMRICRAEKRRKKRAAAG